MCLEHKWIFCWKLVAFYDAITIIHDVIITPGPVLIKLESMLNWVCAQTLKPDLSLRLFWRLNLKLWFAWQKQWKCQQVKSFSRRFIKFDLSNFEISCSAELSMKKVL